MLLGLQSQHKIATKLKEFHAGGRQALDFSCRSVMKLHRQKQDLHLKKIQAAQ